MTTRIVDHQLTDVAHAVLAEYVVTGVAPDPATYSDTWNWEIEEVTRQPIGPSRYNDLVKLVEVTVTVRSQQFGQRTAVASQTVLRRAVP